MATRTALSSYQMYWYPWDDTKKDAWISKHLGMDKDEILRLKQITGLAALFRDVKFGEAWHPV